MNNQSTHIWTYENEKILNNEGLLWCIMNDATEHQIKQMSEQVRKYKLCTQHKNQGDVTLG